MKRNLLQKHWQQLTESAVRRLQAEQLRDYLLTGAVRNAVNMPAVSPEEFKKRLIDDIAVWTALAEQIHFEKI